MSRIHVISRLNQHRSTLFGLSIGAIFYVCYGAAQENWTNATLIAVSTFIGINIPAYSEFSSRIEQRLQLISATVTAGRLGRFAFQFAFNLVVYKLLVLGGVVSSAAISTMGGVVAIAAVTTLASQGFQYAGQAAARRGFGQASWNVLLGLSGNVFLAAMALAGFAEARALFFSSALFFGIATLILGLASDLRAVIHPKGGVAVFFGTFNPFHIGHLELVKRVIAERGVEKVIIHPTIVPKAHADALAKGEITVARIERGMQVFERTGKADRAIDYFPTGNRFYSPEDRCRMIYLALRDAGLTEAVEIAVMPEIYRKRGFHGVFQEIRRMHPNKPIHGVHGSDYGGMLVRTILDESGWHYPLAVVRRGDISATAIRAGRKGLTTPSVTEMLDNLRDDFAAHAMA